MKTSTLSALFAVLALSSAASANPAAGEYFDQDLLAPWQFANYQMVTDDQPTAITVRGDGDGDIDCVVVTISGRELTRDQSASDGCILVVQYEGTVIVQLRNVGDWASVYNLHAW
jgi:hypothetical protein